MLQRSAKYKPESFAPNPGTNIEQIRKFILKKRMYILDLPFKFPMLTKIVIDMHSIKRLMIKNQADNSWDLNEKAVQLICRRGKALEELAVAAAACRAFKSKKFAIALTSGEVCDCIKCGGPLSVLEVKRSARRRRV